MIPYVEPLAWEIGPFTVQGFGVLVALAVIVGVLVYDRRAPRLGIDRRAARDLALVTVAGGFVGSHLFSAIAYYPDRVARDPFELVRVWGSMSSYGGIAGGILAGAAAARRMGVSPLAHLDAVAFAFPFGWIFGRAGCAMAHDHPGIETTHWLAVRFPTGPRLDLGLIELLYTIPLAALFAALGRRRRPRGFFLAAFLVLYAPARFAMDFFRVDDARYLGWTAAQYASIAAFLAGLALLPRNSD